LLGDIDAFSCEHLRTAWARVRKGGKATGIDGQTLEGFDYSLDRHLGILSKDLRAQTYRPLPARRVYVDKCGGGRRPLDISTVRDRVAHRALLDILAPLAEQKLTDVAHAYRPGRSIRMAVDRVRSYYLAGHRNVVRIDVKNCFPTISQDLALRSLRACGVPSAMVRLCDLILTAGTEVNGVFAPTREGLSQGNAISPLLCNIVLDSVDRTAGASAIRYADDFVSACPTPKDADRMRNGIIHGLDRLGLEANPEKSGIANFQSGFRFLGTDFVSGLAIPTIKTRLPNGNIVYRSGYEGKSPDQSIVV